MTRRRRGEGMGVNRGAGRGGAPSLIPPCSPSGSKEEGSIGHRNQILETNSESPPRRPRPPEHDSDGGRAGRVSVKIRLLRSAFPFGSGSPEVRVIG